MKRTHVELIGVASPNSGALIPKLIEEEEPSETKLANKSRETKKRKGSKAAERKLNPRIIRPRVMAIAVGASEHEVRHRRNHERENDEHRPRENRCPRAGLVHAHPSQIFPETMEFVVHVRDRTLELLFTVNQRLSSSSSVVVSLCCGSDVDVRHGRSLGNKNINVCEKLDERFCFFSLSLPRRRLRIRNS